MKKIFFVFTIIFFTLLLNNTAYAQSSCSAIGQTCCTDDALKQKFLDVDASYNGKKHMYCEGNLYCDTAVETCRVQPRGVTNSQCGQENWKCCSIGREDICSDSLNCNASSICVLSNNQQQGANEVQNEPVPVGQNSSEFNTFAELFQGFTNAYKFFSTTTKNCFNEQGVNKTACFNCINQKGVYTAIGCVDPSPTGLITRIIQTAFATLGGVVLIQTIIIGINLQSGDASKIKKSREEITATISGIVVLLFCVLIVQIIGVNILNILPTP